MRAQGTCIVHQPKPGGYYLDGIPHDKAAAIFVFSHFGKQKLTRTALTRAERMKPRNFMGKAVAALFAILASAVALYGWGHEGHRIVADIAQERLTEGAVPTVSLHGGQK